MPETMTVVIKKSEEAAFRNLLAREQASLDADAARIGETTAEPAPPAARPVRRGVRVDAALLREGSAVGRDPGDLQTLAADAGSCELARAWIRYCRVVIGGQRPFGAGGGNDWPLYAPDYLREVEVADRDAATRDAVASERAAVNALPVSDLKARIAELEELVSERGLVVNNAEAALANAKAAVRKAETELQQTRDAIARRDPARIQIDEAQISALATAASCSLQDTERCIRACRGDVARAEAWACGPGSIPDGVRFPVDFSLI
jgi:ElaB/YqjD/DUF883 family membrane-anchored ribosome-binding protein